MEGSNWFDSEGRAEFWNSIPLRTVKKAFFRKGSIVRTLTKLVINSVTYDFVKTAQGGAVIVPPDYSAIEFISPDNRIPYKTLLSGNLGNALTVTIETLTTAPIPSWDRFASWFGSSDALSDLSAGISKCELQTIDGRQSTVVSVPDFTNIKNMVSILEATKAATENAHGQALSMYQLDTAAFGWAIKLTAADGVSITVGFLFRE